MNKQGKDVECIKDKISRIELLASEIRGDFIDPRCECREIIKICQEIKLDIHRIAEEMKGEKK